MIRVRVSTLESYRRVVATEYGDEGELINYVANRQQDVTPPTWKMEAGTAWHTLLAAQDLSVWGVTPEKDVDRARRVRELARFIRYHGEPGGDGARAKLDADLDRMQKDVPELVEEGGYQFSLNAVALGRQVIGPGLWEVTGRKVFDVWGGVEVQGTADHLRGLVIQDQKTKFSPADARDYEASLQWRFYLSIHQAACFRYNLFSFRDPTAKGLCFLTNVTSFRFWPYASLEADCRSWLSDFLAWAESRGLLKHLEVRAA